MPNLKYVYADEIIRRLTEIGEVELCDDITKLYDRYKDLANSYLKHRQEYIIEKLQEFYKENGRSPKHKELLRNSNYPSSTTVATTFGSFNNALIAAGLEINQKANKRFDEDIAKKDLLKFIKANKRLPKSSELHPPTTTYTHKVYYKYWGSILNCAKDLNDDSIKEYIK